MEDKIIKHIFSKIKGQPYNQDYHFSYAPNKYVCSCGKFEAFYKNDFGIEIKLLQIEHILLAEGLGSLIQ